MFKLFISEFLKIKKYFFLFFFFLGLGLNSFAQRKVVAGSLDVIEDVSAVVDDAAAIVSKIDGAFNAVTESDAYKTVVDGKSLQLPYAILPGNGNSDYSLVVNDINMDGVGRITAEIFMRIPVNSEKSLYFMADKVPLNKDGKLQDTLKLFLVTTIESKVGNGYDLIFKGLDNKEEEFSYVSFSCAGFDRLFLNGQLRFDPNAVVKDKGDSQESDPKEPVALDFFVSVDYLTNMIVTFSNVPDLNFTKLPGFKVKVPRIVLDKSDLDNAPGFNLPEWYLDSLERKVSNFDANFYKGVQWQGVYIDSVTIEIPRAFAEGKPQDTATIVSRNLIVDQYGITALTKANSKQDEGIISGEIKGFKHRIDSLEINVIASTLSRAGLWGELSFPLCKEEFTVGFGLVISKKVEQDSELEYNGYVDIKENLKVKAFGLAQMNLSRSKLEFEYSNNQFFPATTIDGTIIIAPKKKGSDKASGNLTMSFANFRIASRRPYVSLVDDGFFRMALNSNNSKLSKLPIKISEPPSLITETAGQRMGLKMGISVSFQKSNGDDGESAGGLNAGGTFIIWANRNPGSKRWAYDGFQLDSLGVNSSGSGYSLEGSLKMFTADPVYGDGYCGKFNLTVIDKFTVDASAIFGKAGVVEVDQNANFEAGTTMSFASNVETDGDDTKFRYWFVDAMFSFSPAIPIFTGVELNSFTGGLYKNMVMVKKVSGSKVDCLTASGREYIPQKGLFGLIAGIGVQSPGGGDAFNGNINFGLEFYNSGGLKRIATWGGVEFFTTKFDPPPIAEVAKAMDKNPPADTTADAQKKAPAPKPAAVSANWYVEYDVDNKIFSGDFDIFVNVANVVKGTGTNHKAGHLAIYGSPSKWYVWIGQPANDKVIGLKVINLLTIKSYLCIGDTLPNPAIMPLPPEVTKPPGGIDYGILAVGGGLSFGARMEFSGFPSIPLIPCKLKVGLAYQIIAGFDILLSKSNKPIYCSNVGADRGINNWYATGQAFFYGSGALRAKWKGCGGGSKDLFSVYLSAFVFAQLPRPSYLTGNVTLGFTIIKTFKKSFNIEKGKQCRSAALDSKVFFVESILPSDSTGGVPVGQDIEVFFSKPIFDFTYTIQNNGQNKAGEKYRGSIGEENIKLLSSSGEELPFELKMSDDNLHLLITPTRVLPGDDSIKVIVRVITQIENTSETGDDWIDGEGVEEKIVTFKTASDVNYVPLQDIYYAYPSPFMDNFHLKESPDGYITLETLPQKAKLLHPDYEFAVAFYEGNNLLDVVRNVTYNDKIGAKNFVFPIPETRMKKGSTYTLKVMKTPILTFTSESSTQTSETEEEGTVDPNYQDSVIISYNFTTSKFLTFHEKMKFYGGAIGEVFDGVVAADLSVNKIEDIDEDAFEPLSELETIGYMKNGVPLTEPYVRFGDIDYFSQSSQAIQDRINEYSGLHLSTNGNSDGYEVISTLFNDVNQGLSEVNLKCLLEGGCSGSQLEVVQIPRGKFTLPVGYYPPGETRPTSIYNMIIDLQSDIKLPF